MIDAAELDKMEQVACDQDTYLGQCCRKLISEVRNLQHQLDDPNYQYAGSRIHRQAIVVRNAEIDKLRKAAQPQIDDLR